MAALTTLRPPEGLDADSSTTFPAGEGTDVKRLATKAT